MALKLFERLRNRLRILGQLKVVSGSGLFDREYYIQENPDVEHSGINPLRHFLFFGWREGRNPSRGFDTLYYLRENPDVKDSGMNPLVHYILYGKSECRKALPGSAPGHFYLNDNQRENFLSGKRELFEEFLNSRTRLEVPACEPAVSIIVILHNRAELSYACVKSVIEFAGVCYELIIVDNNSTDRTGMLLERIDGARIVRNRENRHFLAGSNQAADYADGKNILFLNSDAELLEGSLQAALKTIEEIPFCGAVGGKLISPDGMLQEAGSIIWKDGSCSAYGRGESPAAPEYNFYREVDTCVGAFLLTGTGIFRSHGKFDERFMPAYYEDTDYCLRIQESGFRVVYNPDVIVRHFEFGSSSVKKAAPLMERSGRAFFQKHKQKLEGFKPSSAGMLKARFASLAAHGKTILYIDERIPHLDLGCGYPRSNAVLRCLRELNHRVTMYPYFLFDEKTRREAFRDIDPFIEIIPFSSKESFPEFLEERRGYFDIVWVSRPTTMRAVGGELLNYREEFKIVYDAEAVWAEREFLSRSFVNRGRGDNFDFIRALRGEFELCRAADMVVAVSENDAMKFKKNGFGNVSVLGHAVDARPTPRDFSTRKGLLFVGNLDLDDTPNGDSVKWFVKEVLPLIRKELGGVELHVAGSCGSMLNKILETESVFFHGKVDDLYDYYNRCRVFIAPTRFAAGIPCKIYESASYGLPAVATGLLAGQLNWTDRVHLLAADAEKNDFAQKTLELYRDEGLWCKLRGNALEKVDSEASYALFRGNIRRIIEALD